MTTTTNAKNNLTSGSKLTAAVQTYRARRSARALRTRVEQELSSYRTQAEIHELDAMLDRAGDDIDPVYIEVVNRLRMRAA